MDGPLSNLNAKLRQRMRLEIKQLVKLPNMATLYVTHDQMDVLSMSDRIAVMDEGRIMQGGEHGRTK